MRTIVNNPNMYGNSAVTFENNISLPNGEVRRVDAVIQRSGSDPIFVEHKSSRGVPPNGFVEQFAKDMNNPNVNGIDQIKWVFDAEKQTIGRGEKGKIFDAFKAAIEVDNSLVSHDSMMRMLDGVATGAPVFDKELILGMLRSNASRIFTSM